MRSGRGRRRAATTHATLGRANVARSRAALPAATAARCLHARGWLQRSINRTPSLLLRLLRGCPWAVTGIACGRRLRHSDILRAIHYSLRSAERVGE